MRLLLSFLTVFLFNSTAAFATQIVLLVTTSHDTIEKTGKPTGAWLEEVAVPYQLFEDAGYRVEIASIKGGKVPVDPRSYDDPSEHVKAFKANDAAMKKLEDSLTIASLKDVSHYSAVFLPGGHGTMFDFPNNAELDELLQQFVNADKPIGAVCHGPAGLLGVKDKDGTLLVNGKQVAAFTNSEEDAVELTHVMPFLLEDQFVDLGAVYTKVTNFAPHAVRDGLLITGQNPASSELVAKLMIQVLTETN